MVTLSNVNQNVAGGERNGEVENELKCRHLTVVIGMQVNFGLEISMNDTNYLISYNIYRSELIHYADINLCHSDLFPSQTELKVIGLIHSYVRLKL
jgi:hypothetical protein